MRLFINDRLFGPSRYPKLLVLSTEDRQRVGNGSDLGVKFSWSDENGNAVLAPSLDKSKTSDVRAANPTIPLSAAEFETAAVSPGSYWITAALPMQTIDRTHVTVLDAKQEEELIASIVNERLAGGTEGGQLDGPAWTAGWNSVREYLGIPLTPHVAFTVGSPGGRGGGNAPDAWSQVAFGANAASFVSFHALRFAFDHVFYGGTINVTPIPGKQTGETRFSIALRPRVQPQPSEGSSERVAELRRLLVSLKSSGIDVQVDWPPITPPGVMEIGLRRTGL
jgi:hypothetical protein